MVVYSLSNYTRKRLKAINCLARFPLRSKDTEFPTYRIIFMNLTIYSVDDGMWRAILPLSLLREDFNLESLWESVKSWISPNLTQEYFREFTSEIFGVTEFEWN